MFNLIKTGTYYFLFKKFKKQIFIILFSLIAIFVIDSIFKDIVSALDKKDIFFAIAIKWSLIIFIIFFNFFIFKKVTKKEETLSKKPQPDLHKKPRKKEIKSTPHFEEIIKKDKLLTKKGILNKYLKN